MEDTLGLPASLLPLGAANPTSHPSVGRWASPKGFSGNGDMGMLDSWHHGLEGRPMTLPLTSSEAKTHDLILTTCAIERGSPGFESWYCHL